MLLQDDGTLVGMKGLGALEAAVMDRLWRTAEPASVRDVFETLVQDREIAYTTVLTVLDNLHKKDLVKRTKVARAWQYESRLSRDEYTSGVLTDAVAGATNRGSAILRFVETLKPDEIAELKAFLNEQDPD